MILAHTGPTAPVALAGESAGVVSLAGVDRVVLQADLRTSPTARLYYRVAYGAEPAATTLATAEAYMTDGGQDELLLDPYATSAPPALCWLLVDADGADADGGADDVLRLLALARLPEVAR